MSGGPSGNLYNAWASFLLGLSRPARPPEPHGSAVHDADAELQLLRARSVAGDQPHDGFVSARATSTSPCRRATDRGLERYNPDTNMMEIGGVGSVPTDLGIKMEKGPVRAARRRDVPRVADDGPPRRVRHHQRSVLAGAADAHEPSRPAQPDRRGAEPVLVGRPDGRRRAADRRMPDLGNGIIPIPSNVTRVHAARRTSTAATSSRGTPRCRRS